MRVQLFNHHTPYLALLARALPDVEWLVLRTVGHAPNGWRVDQRPKPDNVTVKAEPEPAEVVIRQNDWDLAVKVPGRPAEVFLAHNRAEFEGIAPQWVCQWPHVRLVCISHTKADTWRRACQRELPITVIPPGVPLNDYGPWRGDVPKVLTVANNLRRPLFDLDAWLEATEGLPVTLVGEGNEGLRGAVGPARDFDELRDLYRSHQVYLGVNKRPNEDPHNLALLEAMATNMPVVYLGGYPDRIQTARQLRERCKGFLRDAVEDRSRPWNLGWPGYLADQFSFERFAANWRRVLEEVAGG